jgi:hypothetical protein
MRSFVGYSDNLACATDADEGDGSRISLFALLPGIAGLMEDLDANTLHRNVVRFT